MFSCDFVRVYEKRTQDTKKVFPHERAIIVALYQIELFFDLKLFYFEIGSTN